MMGIPNWMWKKVFDIKIIDRIISFFTKPFISLLLFSGMFSVYHYPIILDNVKLSAAIACDFYNNIIYCQQYFFGGQLLIRLKANRNFMV